MIPPGAQRLVTYIMYLFLGGSFVAAILGAINDAMAFVDTPIRAFIGSVAIGAIWLTAELITRHGVRWRVGTSNVTLRRLGIQPRLAAIGAIIFLWLPQGVNLFKTPDEVSSLPHILYEYTSNYPKTFLRLKQTRPPLSGELQSTLSLVNNSNYILENIQITTYILCNTRDFSKFLKPYYLNTSEYLLIGSHTFARMEAKKTLSLDILEGLRELFKTQENLERVVLPELGRQQSLPKVDGICPTTPPTYPFTDDESMLQEEFFPLVPQNIHMGRDAEYGFNGAMLKVIVQYDVKGFSFKHLLVGGLYYKYIITLVQIKV